MGHPQSIAVIHQVKSAMLLSRPLPERYARGFGLDFPDSLFRVIGGIVPGFSYTPLSKSRTTSAIVTLRASQARKSVVTVMGRPDSNCCQCFPENPNKIMSSCDSSR
jgi:hypothetical protein